MLKTLYKEACKHTYNDTEVMLHMKYQLANKPRLRIKGKSIVRVELEREQDIDCRYYMPKYFQRRSRSYYLKVNVKSQK